ncbi:MAG: hypothetical protein ACLQVG_16765 [Terriglobia bacterium]
MKIRKVITVLALTGVVFSLLSFVPNKFIRPTPVAFAASTCTPVGGVLMTNIGAIGSVYNLGPVYGDLAGSVAANIVGETSTTFTLQHYWVTAGGGSIYFAPAVLTPTYPTSSTAIVAVPWGNYISKITGGTGKFSGATGSLSYFGMADFVKNTLVLRYSGEVCYAN